MLFNSFYKWLMTDTTNSNGDQGQALPADALEQLRSNLGCSMEDLGGLVSIFQRNARERVVEAFDALGRADLQTAGRAVHSLKSNARTFSAADLASLCVKAEAAARAGDSEPIGGLLEQIRVELEQVLAAVARQLESLQRSAGGGSS